MVHDERTRLCICALDLYRPLLRFGVLRCVRDGGGCPHVQFERVRVTLEPICDLPYLVRVHAIGEWDYFWLLSVQTHVLARLAGS